MPGEAAPAGLIRRLAALAYDLLLLAGVLFVFTLLVLFARGGREIAPGTWWFDVGLVAVCAAFFVWFWTHGGQTLGMRAWRLKLVARDGGPVGLGQALGRFGAAIVSAAPAGLGFWWSLLDRERSCWHDRWSGTRLLHVKPPDGKPRKKNGK
ncbi:MAG: RDD family protein [Gammaproteobacteria bacterium]|nr:RDD family protein [Gammaproteobacteria bacterium]